ncbi:MAG: hypothetical protein WBX50_04555 [Candidatus Deferrimicrobiaceae bacterium]
MRVAPVNTNRVLADAIGAGHRGAYWDILRRCSQIQDGRSPCPPV